MSRFNHDHLAVKELVVERLVCKSGNGLHQIAIDSDPDGVCLSVEHGDGRRLDIAIVKESLFLWMLPKGYDDGRKPSLVIVSSPEGVRLGVDCVEKECVPLTPDLLNKLQGKTDASE